MSNFEIRQGDFGRSFQVRFRNADGTDAIIPAGTTLLFRMVSQSSGRVVEGAASLSNPAGLTTNNIATYIFGDGDSDQPGLYNPEFVATYPGGAGVETFPSSSKRSRGLVIEVSPKL